MMPQDAGEIWQYERGHQKMIVIVIDIRLNIYSRYYAYCDCYVISSYAIAEFQTGEIKSIYLSEDDGWKKVT